ncbi:iron-containing alcohol dehydrogenase [Brevibacillus humidisoli]|uniref:iron-containing alcohol dehydrogenase n=1 Tax=Brevibacillus humidisoli TaxID=2895522 RepID=UPI001E3C7122|nr:iron-containing alcohol dehydrogenase [Brevibacillus humidisoli]UFJ39313.1 iron-containing alcohol dehydrogenase [Brevibacillus humidisoli]
MGTYSVFRMPETVLYGRDSFDQVGVQAARWAKKALVISDQVMDSLGVVRRCYKLLADAGLSYASYLQVDSEPTDIHVRESLDVCLREKCKVIITIGGGSCIDAGKAVALLATNGGYIGDYTGGKTPVLHGSLPLIAVPTTAGTGSEVTDVTVITNTAEHVKMMIKHPFLLPTAAIVDPVLTLTSPPHVTAATGIDALCHAMEAYLSRRAQPMTDMLALSAIDLICRNIRKAYNDGTDLEAREQMALAAMKAGAAFSNASVCLVHGMSRPIGALFHVPHGVSNAMLLPAVLEYSKDACTSRLAEIARRIDRRLGDDPDVEAAEETVKQVKLLCADLQIPNMKNWGIDRNRLDQVVAKMVADAIASGSPANNPKVPTETEIAELYGICYDYSFT